MHFLDFDCLESINMSKFREKMTVELYIHAIQRSALAYKSDDERGCRVPCVRFKPLFQSQD